jgi:hypothetical protein
MDNLPLYPGSVRYFLDAVRVNRNDGMSAELSHIETELVGP